AVDRQEDALGAQRAGGPERHRRMDAEDPRLVARGADNAALVWAATTHDHGLAAKLRPIALLDGGEERVEVDVKDRPVDRRLGAHPGIIAPPSTDFDRMFDGSAPVGAVSSAL